MLAVDKGSALAANRTLDIAPWREHLVLRELAATMATLSSRVLSYGNREALLEAGSDMQVLLDQLAAPGGGGAIISSQAVESLRSLLGSMRGASPAAFARVALTPVEDALAVAYVEMRGDGERGVVSYGQRRLPLRSADRILIEVGPTIGLGDELLFACAVAERAASAPYVGVLASTRRHQLWSLHSGFSKIALPPPLGVVDELARLAPDARRRTAVARLDFLPGPTGSPAYVGPGDVAYGGYWTMGPAEGQFVEPRAGVRHVWRYPGSLPQCRWFEARWAAGRIVPGSRPAGPSAEPARHSVDRPRVVLQVLTAKPSLMFPPRFYVRVLDALRRSFDDDFVVEVLPAPSAADSAAVANAVACLRAALGEDRVEACPATGLEGVVAAVRAADLLIGPDSFTTHVADLLRVPQVVIAHHEHAAWITPFRPRITVHPSRAGVDALVDSVGGFAAALLHATRGMDRAELSDVAAEWVTRLGTVDGWVRDFLHEPGTVEAELPLPDMSAVGRLVAASPLLRTKSLELGERSPATRVDLSAYEHPDEAAAAVVRWHHRMTTTKLSGLLLASHAAS